MIQYIHSENKYIVSLNGLYLEQIKIQRCKLTTEISRAKRFDNADEAEFFYDIFIERHKVKKPSSKELNTYRAVAIFFVLSIVYILWQLSKGIY